MPRSSRHKSLSKRDYSDSEKDSSSKDRKGGGGKGEAAGSRVSKEVGGSSEKRKFVDSKEGGNGEYVEEYSSSSKRRRDRAEESGEDRWNGGGDVGRKPGKEKEKEKAEMRVKRRDEGFAGESEELVKKVSSGKSEGKHKDSDGRKEGRDGEADRERDRDRGKEREREREREKKGMIEKVVDEPLSGKHFTEKTVVSVNDQMPSPESENQLDRRIRKKRVFSDTDKPVDIVGNINDRHLSSKEEAAKDGRTNDDKYRDKYRDEVDRENRHRDVRDEHAARDHSSNRSDDRHVKDEKEASETRQKKSKPQDGDRHRDRDREYERTQDYVRGHDRDYERKRDRDHDHYRERGREKERRRDRLYDGNWDEDHDFDDDRDWDLDRDHHLERHLDRDRDRDHGGDRERDRGRDRFSENDIAFADDRSTRSKESRGRKRSPDEFDDYSGSKYRGSKTTYHDMGKKSESTGRDELDGDRGRPQSIQAPVDKAPSSDKRHTSPSTNSHGTQEEYRYAKLEESKYIDAVSEERTKPSSSREAANVLGSSDRASNYRSSEKPVKTDDGHFMELSQEKPAGSKAPSMGLTDRSPSSLSLDRGRYSNRSVARRSLEIDDMGRRGHSSTGHRDFQSSDDRTNRDLPLDKPLADDVTCMDSPFHNRVSHNHPASVPSGFRGRIGSPSFMGSMEEDGRPGSGARHKRSGDLPRGQGNPWRGPPNWPSPMPNGFMPFQHGPPHGGFPPMMPQFPSLFGVRPSIDMNHSGMPYHIPDADRFSGHFRPLGWQNMMDGSGPHLHGWDGSNGVFRDDVLFGGPDWEQKRNHMNGWGWESSTELWKGQNGDVNMEMPPASSKEDFPLQPLVDDALKSGQASRSLQNDINENNQLAYEAKDMENKLAVSPASRESVELSPKTTFEMAPDPPKTTSDNDATHFCHAYLSKLDISTELASPELYNQCMSLISMELSAAVDEDSVLLVNLKDGAMAVPKGSIATLSTSLFSAASDSVSQRALDLYRKQRAGSILSRSPDVVAGEIISTTKVGEQVSVNYGEGPDRPVLEYNVEMTEVPESDLDQKIVASPSNKENTEKEIPASDCEGDGQGHAPSVKMELLDQSFSQDVTTNPTETVTGTDMEGMRPLPVHRDDAEDNGDANAGNMSDSAATLMDDARIDEKVEVGNNIPVFAEVGQDPLVFEDDPSMASGELMPKFSESESVILSRIHHSSESTH